MSQAGTRQLREYLTWHRNQRRLWRAAYRWYQEMLRSDPDAAALGKAIVGLMDAITDLVPEKDEADGDAE